MEIPTTLSCAISSSNVDYISTTDFKSNFTLNKLYYRLKQRCINMINSISLTLSYFCCFYCIYFSTYFLITTNLMSITIYRSIYIIYIRDLIGLQVSRTLRCVNIAVVQMTSYKTPLISHYNSQMEPYF